MATRSLTVGSSCPIRSLDPRNDTAVVMTQLGVRRVPKETRIEPHNGAKLQLNTKLGQEVSEKSQSSFLVTDGVFPLHSFNLKSPQLDWTRLRSPSKAKSPLTSCATAPYLCHRNFVVFPASLHAFSFFIFDSTRPSSYFLKTF